MADLAAWKRQQQLTQGALVRGRDTCLEIGVSAGSRRENQYPLKHGPARGNNAIGPVPPTGPAVRSVGVGETGIQRAAPRLSTQLLRQRRVGE